MWPLWDERSFSLLFSADRTQEIQAGTIGCGLLQRQWAQLSLGQEVNVEAYDPFSAQGQGVYLAGVDLEVDFLARGIVNDQPYSQDELAERFIQVSTCAAAQCLCKNDSL